MSIPVGPTRSVKDLSRITGSGEYVLDAGPIYAVPPLTVKNFILRSADPTKLATVKFPSCWPTSIKPGADLGQPNREGTLRAIGPCTVKDLNVVGGKGVIVLGSQPGADIIVQNVHQDGGAIIRGGGWGSLSIKAWSSAGTPIAYAISNFTNPARKSLIDLTGCRGVAQGGQMNGGQPQGETAIRIMDAEELEYIGVKTIPWFYEKDKHGNPVIWKQDIQFRPTSGKIVCTGCEFTLPDIGDMTWRKPPQQIQELWFIDCTIHQEPHVTDGCRKIVYQNTTVAGKMRNETITPKE